MSRRELAKHQRFEQVSPEVGEIDEEALDDLMQADPDEALAMLADLVGATDERLRALARQLAGRLFLDLARSGGLVRRGAGRLVELPYQPDAGDLDVDRSLDAILEAVAGKHLVDVSKLRVRGWAKRTTALCLLIDRSGSMGGKPLATAALAAAAVACREPDDYSVVAFGKDMVIAKSQRSDKPSARVVTDVLSLRGFGTTDVAGALQIGALQLSRSAAKRKVTILLSDCRSTVDGDPLAAARAIDELVIIAPESDDVEARAFAASSGARIATVDGPSQIAAAIASVLQTG